MRVGYASNEGKAFVVKELLDLPREHQPEAFLDLGAGAGSWLEAVKPWYLDSSWIAIEAWNPYIERFCLGDRYELVIKGDIRTTRFPQVDVVIMGDVLEHMQTEDAILVWKKAREAARLAAITSIPIVHYEQGHVHDNPFQEHVRPDYTHEEVLATFEGIDSVSQGKTVGTYIAWTPEGWV